jgi:hypothetical protein
MSNKVNIIGNIFKIKGQRDNNKLGGYLKISFALSIEGGKLYLLYFTS